VLELGHHCLMTYAAACFLDINIYYLQAHKILPDIAINVRPINENHKFIGSSHETIPLMDNANRNVCQNSPQVDARGAYKKKRRETNSEFFRTLDPGGTVTF
jgi:hypothetical protein